MWEGQLVLQISVWASYPRVHCSTNAYVPPQNAEAETGSTTGVQRHWTGEREQGAPILSYYGCWPPLLKQKSVPEYIFRASTHIKLRTAVQRIVFLGCYANRCPLYGVSLEDTSPQPGLNRPSFSLYANENRWYMVRFSWNNINLNHISWQVCVLEPQSHSANQNLPPPPPPPRYAS